MFRISFLSANLSHLRFHLYDRGLSHLFSTPGSHGIPTQEKCWLQRKWDFQTENPKVIDFLQKQSQSLEDLKTFLSVQKQEEIKHAACEKNLKESQKLLQESRASEEELKGQFLKLHPRIQELKKELEDKKAQNSKKDELLEEEKGHNQKLKRKLEDCEDERTKFKKLCEESRDTTEAAKVMAEENIKLKKKVSSLKMSLASMNEIMEKISKSCREEEAGTENEEEDLKS